MATCDRIFFNALNIEKRLKNEERDNNFAVFCFKWAGGFQYWILNHIIIVIYAMFLKALNELLKQKTKMTTENVFVRYIVLHI